MQTIELENIGPVGHVSIPCPEGGGLIILHSDNGKGKSKTLDAIESALTGKGSLTVKDGELNGHIDAFGVTITVARSTRRKGELTVESLSGRLSLGDLIDPGLKSPEAADAKRIKALCALAGAKADAALFHGLVGGQANFDRLVSSEAAKTDDLILMADRIKRSLEAKARDAEDAAEKAEGKAAGGIAATANVDVEKESHSGTLQASHEKAVREESRLKTQWESHAKAMKAARLAKDQLEDAEASYSGPSIADATEGQLNAEAVEKNCEAAVRRAEEALRLAKTDHETARNNLAHCIAVRKSAEQHESMVRQWRDQIAASIPEAPSAEALEAAAAAVSKARQALEDGALIRQAIATLAEVDKAKEEAKKQRNAAAMLREAAKGTDEVLSGVVSKLGTPLRVEAGRLITTTERGKTFFDDLSAGQRAKIAVDIGIDAAGDNAVIVFPQEKFEGLSPRNRRMVAERARERGALIITAVATDDEELTAEVFEPEGEAAAV